MKSNQNPSLEQPTSVPDYNFMGYLSPSDMALNEQQKVEDYNQIYKALSQGVYQSSDTFQVESNIDEENQSTDQKSHQSNNSEHQKGQQLKNENEPRYLNEGNKKFQQSENGQNVLDMKDNEQVRLFSEQIQGQQVQNKKVQTIKNSSKVPEMEQQQQFFFAESMSHYESVMQFASPSLMEESVESKAEAEKLDKIQEQIDINEQTNQIRIDQSLNYQKNKQNQVNEAQPISIFLQEQIKIQDKGKIEISSENHPLNIEQRIRSNYNQLQFVKRQLKKFTRSMQKGKIRIAISGYEKQYFLKMQTQLYHIDVHRQDKQYTIKRRFADFVSLQQLVRVQYSGYILYPFPEKSIELFKKMNFSMGSQQEKIVLVEKRLLQLQNYVNFLFRHQQISTSFPLQVFIQQNHQFFQKEMSSIQSLSQSQENDLQLGIIEKSYNNIKKLVRTNFTFFKSYFAPEDAQEKEKLDDLKLRCRKNNEKFTLFQKDLQNFTNQLNNFSTKILKIASIYKQNSQLPNLQSNIDSVLSFGSKLSSSRTFYGKFSDLIQDYILIDARYYDHLLRNVDSLIKYRQKLINKLNSLETQHYGIGTRLQEKIKFFDDRFEQDWTNLCQQINQNINILYQKFHELWKHHCSLMSKLWN